MRGPKTALISHEKARPLMMKRGKTKASEKSNSSELKPSKDLNAPKRPPTAFFVFMEEFRKHFKENFPDNKSVAAVSKAGGVKWKSMSDSDKAPYTEKALKKKAQYEEAMTSYKKNKTLSENVDNERSVESEKSTCESNDTAAAADDEQEATASS